jgi:hypothetical protein
MILSPPFEGGPNSNSSLVTYKTAMTMPNDYLNENQGKFLLVVGSMIEMTLLY